MFVIAALLLLSLTMAVNVTYQIEINNATDLVAFEFDSVYSEQLTFVNFEDGGILGDDLLIVQPTDNQSNNSLDDAIIMILTGPSFQGSGTLARMNFVALANATPSEFNITNILFANSSAQQVTINYTLATYNNGVIWQTIVQAPIQNETNVTNNETNEEPTEPPTLPTTPTPLLAFSQQFQPIPKGSRYESSDLGAIVADGLGTFFASLTYVADLIIIGFVALAVVGIVSVMKPLLKSK